jgi:hypothetical protein
MAKPPISVSFQNFHLGFNPTRNFYTRTLAKRFRVNVEETGKDIQFTSVFGRRRLPPVPGHRPLRVWYSGEARDPAMQVFDLHIGFQPPAILGAKRWIRFPLWILYIDWFHTNRERTIDRLLQPRRPTPRSRFCNFIFSNDMSLRAEFFLRLNERREVDSLGSILNNRGRRARGQLGKIAAIRDSLFTIAFENQISPGYVTEKILHPLMAGSIPIYWGAREALTDFNPAAFIYAPDFPDLETLVDHVLALADDKDRLEAMATAPVFRNNEVRYEHTPDSLLARLEEAMASEERISERWITQAFLPDETLPEEQPTKRLRRAIRQRFRHPFG